MGIRSKFFVAGSAAFASMAFVSSAHAQTLFTLAQASTTAQAFTLSESGGSLSTNSHATDGMYSLSGALNTSLNYTSGVSTPSTPNTSASYTSVLTSFNAIGGTYSNLFAGSTVIGYEITFAGTSGSIQSSASGGLNFLSLGYGTEDADNTPTPPGSNPNPGTQSQIQLIYITGSNYSYISVSSSEPEGSSSSLTDFTSDIYDFNNTGGAGPVITEAYSLQFGSINAASGGIATGFNASGQFTFNTNPAPEALPEPSSIALAFLGAAGLVLPVLKRKRSKA